MKRPNTIRVDASSVQGEGAYITWKRLTWGERREMLDGWKAAPNDEARTAYAQEVLLKHLVGWNWVDANGDPMPLPTSIEPREESLYPEETDFLYAVARQAILGRLAISDEDLKN